MKESSSEHALEHFIHLGVTSIPKHVSQYMKICTVEFAGVKFKLGNVKSGKEYIQVVESMLRKYLKHAENVSKMVIFEETYSFTPDDLKASTRQQRLKTAKQRDVDHSKPTATFLNESTFNTEVVTKAEAGKRMISTYMAENCTSLVLDRDIKVVIDSELYKSKQCSCTPHPCGSSSGQCDCREYCESIWVQFSSHDGCKTDQPCVTREKVVQQCKREAEMAVVDWLVYYKDLLQAGDSVICFVTPGDIDAICIHLFALGIGNEKKMQSSKTMFTLSCKSLMVRVTFTT
ncbi:hypothetical protein DPMN_155771 [Dreissena polymorpha]|uniref:Uncharacterized protein n=1 Tax=Dreissena polymorpha TaxID=45954 RepID=A0A9D4JBN9_DREPO|nr:hypothetical protein DPMN_155771 [Dreissena polymorpha]